MRRLAQDDPPEGGEPLPHWNTAERHRQQLVPAGAGERQLAAQCLARAGYRSQQACVDQAIRARHMGVEAVGDDLPYPHEVLDDPR